jgi:hypothetical protein
VQVGVSLKYRAQNWLSSGVARSGALIVTDMMAFIPPSEAWTCRRSPWVTFNRLTLERQCGNCEETVESVRVRA